jgi:hypothetical protein
VTRAPRPLATFALGLAGLLGGLLAAGCSPTDVVVADRPAAGGHAGQGGSGGSAGSAGQGGAGGGPETDDCTSNADCGPTDLCARHDCDAAAGHCEPLPLSCGAEEGNVCGCDGVSYWNDCLRKQAGTTASTPGRCDKNARKCGGPMHQECPIEGASCAQLQGPPGPCLDPLAPGVCWLLPAACPPATDTGWEPCGQASPMPPPMPCVPLCEAIRAGTPHRHHQGDHCP